MLLLLEELVLVVLVHHRARHHLGEFSAHRVMLAILGLVLMRSVEALRSPQLSFLRLGKRPASLLWCFVKSLGIVVLERLSLHRPHWCFSGRDGELHLALWNIRSCQLIFNRGA